jgi:hypothetical protein
MQTQFAIRKNVGSKLRSWVVRGVRYFKYDKESGVNPYGPFDGGTASTTSFAATLDNGFGTTTSFSANYNGGAASN